MTYDELKTEFLHRVNLLKLTDMTALNRKCAKILGKIVSENVFEIDDISESCKKILREYYELMNETNARLQKEIDKKTGLRITAQKADFPAERVTQISKSLTDPTVPPETIQRRARSAVENVANSFHDDYVRENAKFRSKAGIKCYIVRETDGNCCKWCTSLAGRYVYGEEPGEVYHRHDNCTCTTTFENGRERQDVWSKKKWEVSPILKIPYEPLVLNKNQAESLQKIQLAKYKNLGNGLTSISNSGTMKNIQLPYETDEIRSMSKETKKIISETFDKIKAEYNIEIDELVTEPLKETERNVPFQFQPVRGKDGELIKRIVINSDYDFMSTHEQFQARILRNFNRKVLASNSVSGLIAHEAAHVMTFQDISTFSGYLLENKSVSRKMVYGISLYADASGDGAECIAEAFAAKWCGLPINPEAQKLLDEFIERWRK